MENLFVRPCISDIILLKWVIEKYVVKFYIVGIGLAWCPVKSFYSGCCELPCSIMTGNFLD
jgi:hypothetical protein